MFFVRSILQPKEPNFIGPLSFCIGPIKWSLTGSKLSHSIDSVLSASGSIYNNEKHFDGLVFNSKCLLSRE